MKEKGTRAERELLHLFYSKGFACMRAAGSGSITIPSVDLLVSYKGRVLAIECKSLRQHKKYFQRENLQQLREFSRKFMAMPLLAIRFDREGWFFIGPNRLERSVNGNYSISLENIKVKGLTFDRLVKQIKDNTL